MQRVGPGQALTLEVAKGAEGGAEGICREGSGAQGEGKGSAQALELSTRGRAVCKEPSCVWWGAGFRGSLSLGCHLEPESEAWHSATVRPGGSHTAVEEGWETPL